MRHKIIILIILTLFYSCNQTKLIPDSDNGGLLLPDGFGALVVNEGVGESRHIAVNSNGDIYVKLRTDTGKNGNVALRDVDGDGKADIIKRFGDYPNDGRFATEMKIHNGYLYYSSELVVYRQKLDDSKLVPDGKPQVLVIHNDSKFEVRKKPWNTERHPSPGMGTLASLENASFL